MAIQLVSPVQEPVEQNYALAPRLDTLSGKTLGLYNNTRLNSNALLEMIAEELGKHAKFNIRRGEYLIWNVMEPQAWGEVDRCDAVILANGDCGSCSSSGIANAIELEKRGIPAMLVATPPFDQACANMAELGGIKEIRWALVDHPISNNQTDADLRERAISAATQFEEIILKPIPAAAA